SRDNVFDMAGPYTFSGGATHAGIMRVIDDRANNADPSIISPATITADQNDYNPTGLQYANTLRLLSDAARNITGLQKGWFNRKVTIFNIGGTNNITLVSNSTSSAAGNRFFLRANRTLVPGDCLTLWYDAAASGWRELASTL